MIWRKSFVSPIVVEPNLPSLVGQRLDGSLASFPTEGAILTGVSDRAVLDFEVWRRLVLSVGFDEPMISLVRQTWSDSERLHFANLLSERERRLAVCWFDPDRQWIEQFGETDRSIALALSGGSIKLAVLGRPTEDAWEAFQEALA